MAISIWTRVWPRGHVGTWPIQNRRIPQVHTYVLTPGKKFHLPRINIGQEPWLAMLRDKIIQIRIELIN